MLASGRVEPRYCGRFGAAVPAGMERKRGQTAATTLVVVRGHRGSRRHMSPARP